MNVIDLRQKNNINNPEINPQRRQLLKFVLFGGSAFLLGRLFGPIIRLLGPSNAKDILTETPGNAEKEVQLKNWRVIEKNNQVTFIDKKTNEEVLILD